MKDWMNSKKKICRAERSRVMTVSYVMVEHEHPAQPHQLIVAIARHHCLRHREKKEEEDHLRQEPENPRHKRERPDAERREPTAEKEDRAHRTHQHDADI